MGGRPGIVPGLSEIQWDTEILYTDTGVCGMDGLPGISPGLLKYKGIRGCSDTGICRMGGRPWTVGDTMAYGDTLTQGSVGWIVV